MLDIKFIRNNPDLIRAGLKNKKESFDLDSFLAIDSKRKDINFKIEENKALQNKINKEIQEFIKDKKDPKDAIIKGKEIKSEVAFLEGKILKLNEQFDLQILKIANMPHASVPLGGIEKNEIIKTVGELKKFDFAPLDHVKLSEKLDIIDFTRASKICGSNFVMFKNEGARLSRALINFMLDLHTKDHGYNEIFPPLLANRASMTATGQLPKLEDDMYHLGEEDYFLIPTAEVPVTNIHRDEILDEDDLPIKYTAYTPCFRREAGSYGKETRGLMRLHQFNKVEMVKFVKPSDSYDELEKLLGNACRILDLLELPYRVVCLASGDLSFAAAKCYDIEIYAPGIDKWLEVSSCSNFEDFQARRGNIRYREKSSQKLKFVHTLNGSGLALPRLIISLLENYQTENGVVCIPKILRPYYEGKEELKK